MNISNPSIQSGRRRAQSAMTLVEVMIASAISTVVIAIVMVLVVFAVRSFAALANYQVLDQASSSAADHMSREIREATSVVSFQNVGTTKSIVFDNTNASPSYTLLYEWTEADQTLTSKRSDQPDTKVLLEGCERWDFTFQQRTPLKGPTFGFSTNMVNKAECKVVTMTWKCSRALGGGTSLFNTESVQTAQIVIRNQKTP
jgi:type II secretory pathway pseudopilin PulG